MIGPVLPTPAEISLQLFRDWGAGEKALVLKLVSSEQLTVEEAALNGLVATEVWIWFYVCEIMGKRGIIGSNV